MPIYDHIQPLCKHGAPVFCCQQCLREMAESWMAQRAADDALTRQFDSHMRRMAEELDREACEGAASADVADLLASMGFKSP